MVLAKFARQQSHQWTTVAPWQKEQYYATEKPYDCDKLWKEHVQSLIKLFFIARKHEYESNSSMSSQWNQMDPVLLQLRPKVWLTLLQVYTWAAFRHALKSGHFVCVCENANVPVDVNAPDSDNRLMRWSFAKSKLRKMSAKFNPDIFLSACQSYSYSVAVHKYLDSDRVILPLYTTNSFEIKQSNCVWGVDF